MLSDPYYVSAARVPRMYPPGSDLAAFQLPSAMGSTSIRTAHDMIDKNPPLEGALASFDPLDLAPHGLYSEYFAAFRYFLTPTERATTYGPVAIDLEPGPVPRAGTPFAAFEIDTSHLNAKYQINFDLYGDRIRSTWLDFNRQAPFEPPTRR